MIMARKPKLPKMKMVIWYLCQKPKCASQIADMLEMSDNNRNIAKTLKQFEKEGMVKYVNLKNKGDYPRSKFDVVTKKYRRLLLNLMNSTYDPDTKLTRIEAKQKIDVIIAKNRNLKYVKKILSQENKEIFRIKKQLNYEMPPTKPKKMKYAKIN